MGSTQTVTVWLNEEETKSLLQEVPGKYHTQVNDVLLTGVAQAFYQWTGNQRLVVDLEGHGREELFAGVDVTRTVGWFTTMYPVVLEFATFWEIVESQLELANMPETAVFSELIDGFPCGRCGNINA